MFDKAHHAINLALDAINSIPAHSYYVAGVLLGSGILISVTTAFITYRHKWKTAEKYAKHLVGYVLVLMASALSVADYFLTNSSNFAVFFGASFPTILAFANKFYEFGGSKLYLKIANVLGQWANGKAQKKQAIFETNPKHAVPAVQTTNDEDESIFS